MSTHPKTAYKRVLLKLSGEALMGSQHSVNAASIATRGNIDPEVIDRIANEVANAHKLGVQIAIVVGGGNYFRGSQGSAWGVDKAAADYVGMLATIMNCLILQEVLKSKGAQVRVMTAIAMPSIAPALLPVLSAVRKLKPQNGSRYKAKI